MSMSFVGGDNAVGRCWFMYNNGVGHPSWNVDVKTKCLIFYVFICEIEKIGNKIFKLFMYLPKRVKEDEKCMCILI
jgi:hypothetical protein